MLTSAQRQVIHDIPRFQLTIAAVVAHGIPFATLLDALFDHDLDLAVETELVGALRVQDVLIGGFRRLEGQFQALRVALDGPRGASQPPRPRSPIVAPPGPTGPR